MIDTLINILGLEEYKNIRKIPKNTFYKEEDFNRTYEKLFTSDIDGIYIISALNKNVVNIKEYKTEDYNYSEIYYIYVALKSDKKINEINKIIHNFIPNPCILLFEYNSKVVITTAKKRINKTDNTRTVIEEHFIGKKIDLEYIKDIDTEFLEDIKLTSNSFENFLRFYMDISNKVFIFSLQDIRGGYKKTSLENIDILISKFKEYSEIKRKIEQLEGEYKKEVGMGAQAQLHSKISDKKKELTQVEDLIKNT